MGCSVGISIWLCAIFRELNIKFHTVDHGKWRSVIATDGFGNRANMDAFYEERDSRLFAIFIAVVRVVGRRYFITY